MKLHLGCGEKYLEGYENVDYPATEHTVMKVRADVYEDIGSMERTVQYEEIRSHHLFEHFTRTKSLQLILKWRGWLQANGRLVIETPDFFGCAVAYTDLWTTRHRRAQLGRHIFGSQEAGWANHLDYWDAGKFDYVLGKLGFRIVSIRRFQNSVAQRYSPSKYLDWLLNIAGNILPDQMYAKYGGHKLPNIVVIAEKEGELERNSDDIVRGILSEYLVGRENETLLNVWIENFKQGK